jgi:hypothetical protein
MTKKMAAALEAAIKHHEKNRAAARKMQYEKISISSFSCPLCQLVNSDCDRCIIRSCYSTPYAELSNVFYNFLSPSSPKKAFDAFADAETEEIKYLKSLRGK